MSNFVRSPSPFPDRVGPGGQVSLRGKMHLQGGAREETRGDRVRKSSCIGCIGPVPEADGHDEPGLVDEAVPGVAAVIDDVGVGGDTRLDNQLSRRNCQMFSTGFNSGARAGSSTSVRLSGTTRSLAQCHPARSISMTPWAPGATACATSAKCRLIACVSHRGRTKAAPLPCWGQIAPKM